MVCISYPSGNTYSGEWKTNQRHGKGTMRWLNLGQKYVGAWQDGHGQGTHSNRYTGEFAQGQRHGWGTFYYAGGAIYEGEWKNNKKHGQVLLFIFPSGSFTSRYRPVLVDKTTNTICTKR
uniref:MORN repeat containing 3 n=1 Tax=Maylandia zebra TaxID=106582 RepID=A0A3P9BNX3_9CICH